MIAAIEHDICSNHKTLCFSVYLYVTLNWSGIAQMRTHPVGHDTSSPLGLCAVSPYILTHDYCLRGDRSNLFKYLFLASRCVKIIDSVNKSQPSLSDILDDITNNCNPNISNNRPCDRWSRHWRLLRRNTGLHQGDISRLSQRGFSLSHDDYMQSRRHLRVRRWHVELVQGEPGRVFDNFCVAFNRVLFSA